MTGFIVSVFILLVIALVFLVPTLLKKNQPFEDDYDELNVSIAKDRLKEIKQQLAAGEISEDTYQQLHDELEATLAIDLENSQSADESLQAATPAQNRIIPIVVATIVPALAFVLYWQLGHFDAATGKAMTAVEIPEGEDRPQMTIEEAIAKLQQRLIEEPDNADGWFMLARTYMTTQQYPQAADAYKTTIDLVGEEPQLLLRYADALAMTEGGRLTGAAKPVIDKVISLVPDSPTVLWMAGTAESQMGNYTRALQHWYRLLPMLGDEPEASAQLNQLVSEAEKHLTSDQIAAIKRELPTSPAPAEQSAGAGAEIIVNVELSPELRSQVSDSDTLFIFAKAVSGPPMPLAAVKQTVSALPITVTLNDAMAMMPQMKLSSFEQVTVSAVVSKSGQPGAQPGDLFAEVSPVNVNAGETVKLLIDQVK